LKTKTPNVILNIIGPPGCGKGSLVKILLERIPKPIHILGTGDRCREEEEKKTSAGDVIAEYTSTGLLVPDRIMLPIIGESMTCLSDFRGVLMADGATRTLAQYEAVINSASIHGFKVHTIFINDCVHECVKRIKDDPNRIHRTDNDDLVLKIRTLEYENHTIEAIEHARGHEGEDFCKINRVDGPRLKAGNVMAFLQSRHPEHFSVSHLASR